MLNRYYENIFALKNAGQLGNLCKIAPKKSGNRKYCPGKLIFKLHLPQSQSVAHIFL